MFKSNVGQLEAAYIENPDVVKVYKTMLSVKYQMEKIMLGLKD